jgi:hypothetical protein
MFDMPVDTQVLAKGNVLKHRSAFNNFYLENNWGEGAVNGQ